MTKKNYYLVIVSNLLGIFLIYIIFFIYFFFNFENEFKHTFKSLENLNFHKKYSNMVHHIRDEVILDSLYKKSKLEDLLFTKISKLEDKEIIVLFQGDSWMEQLTFDDFPNTEDDFISINLVRNFKSKKKIGFVNGGTASYSPTLMNVQLDVLEENFGIFPNVVVAYIDQTDIGDENCRYKYNKVYENGILKLVKPESQLKYRDLFNYSHKYGLSEIYLNNNSKFFRTFQLINFKFKYSIKKVSTRFYRKYISRQKIEKDKLKKCYGGEISRYLISPTKEEIEYFSNSIREYINKTKGKKHIEKLILVTFPHKKHFNVLSGNIKYTQNVSDIVDNVIKNEKNITHINFSKILLNNKDFNPKNIWKDNLHLSYTFHGKLFMRKILDELSK